MKNSSWVEISRQNLKFQAEAFSKLADDAQFFPVVKSNAYGHGMNECVSILNRIRGVAGYMVVSVDEALELSKITTKPIVVLSIWHQDSERIRAAIRKGIRLPIFDIHQARWLQRVALNMKRKAHVHIKVDTGTSRLGFRYDTGITDITNAFALSHLAVEGIFSHFADSENSNESFAKVQEQRFSRVVGELVERGYDIPVKHIACSAAALRSKLYHYTAMRVGISLYGLWPSEDIQFLMRQSQTMKSVLTWKTRVLQVKELRKGDSVGYGRTHAIARKTRIATVAVGYWDGYDRGFSNKADVLINGNRCPVRGLVCMNLTMVELPAKLTVKPGDEVVLLGKSGREEITAEELAKYAGTIHYEITTRINPLTPRYIVR